MDVFNAEKSPFKHCFSYIPQILIGFPFHSVKNVFWFPLWVLILPIGYLEVCCLIFQYWGVFPDTSMLLVSSLILLWSDLYDLSFSNVDLFYGLAFMVTVSCVLEKESVFCYCWVLQMSFRFCKFCCSRPLISLFFFLLFIFVNYWKKSVGSRGFIPPSRFLFLFLASEIPFTLLNSSKLII